MGEKKSIADELCEICSEVCDEICKWMEQYDRMAKAGDEGAEEKLNEKCKECPLRRLY